MGCAPPPDLDRVTGQEKQTMRARNSSKLRAWSIVVAMCCVSGCALPVKQLQTEQPLVPGTGDNFILTEDAECRIGTGYGRTLRKGTRWLQYGTLREGQVYRSPDQVLTAEGFNVHEAYLIVKDATLVGFYLPVEKTFTPVSRQVPLSITTLTGSN
jgi:hypothetical protein